MGAAVIPWLLQLFGVGGGAGAGLTASAAGAGAAGAGASALPAAAASGPASVGLTAASYPAMAGAGAAAPAAANVPGTAGLLGQGAGGLFGGSSGRTPSDPLGLGGLAGDGPTMPPAGQHAIVDMLSRQHQAATNPPGNAIERSLLGPNAGQLLPNEYDAAVTRGRIGAVANLLGGSPGGAVNSYFQSGAQQYGASQRQRFQDIIGQAIADTSDPQQRTRLQILQGGGPDIGWPRVGTQHNPARPYQVHNEQGQQRDAIPQPDGTIQYGPWYTPKRGRGTGGITPNMTRQDVGRQRDRLWAMGLGKDEERKYRRDPGSIEFGRLKNAMQPLLGEQPEDVMRWEQQFNSRQLATPQGTGDNTGADQGPGYMRQLGDFLGLTGGGGNQSVDPSLMKDYGGGGGLPPLPNKPAAPVVLPQNAPAPAPYQAPYHYKGQDMPAQEGGGTDWNAILRERFLNSIMTGGGRY